MVGRSLNPGYRGDLNLLSRRDYTPSPARYIRMRVGAIVGLATAQYHFAGVFCLKKSTEKGSRE